MEHNADVNATVNKTIVLLHSIHQSVSHSVQVKLYSASYQSMDRGA